jgi:hypothetical protein
MGSLCEGIHMLLGVKGEEFPPVEFLGYLGYLGNPQSTAESCGRIIHDDIISQPDRQQTAPTHKSHWFQTTHITSAIHSDQTIVNASELLCRAYSS